MGWETEIDDVVAGQPIESAWGNEIRDKLVHVVSTVAGLPTDVPDGGLAYVTDDDVLYLRRLGAWVVATVPFGPRGVLAYAAVTATQSPITTITDLTGLSVPVTVDAGRVLRVTGQGGITISASGTETIAGVGTVREGTTVLGRWGSFIDNISGARAQLQSGGVIVLNPTPGAHTYKLSLARTVGAGSVGLDAAVDQPAYIAVEDIGPVPV